MNHIVKRILFGLAAVAGAILAIRLLDVLMVWSLYSWFFQTVRNASGLPDTLTGAMSIWFTAIAILLVPTFLSALIFRRGIKKVCIIAAALSAWLVILYFISQPGDGQYFNSMTGQAMYKYAKTPDGRIDTFPLGYNFHPRYGTKLELVTTEVITQLEKQKYPPEIVPVEIPKALPKEEPKGVPKASAPRAVCKYATITLEKVRRIAGKTILRMEISGDSYYTIHFNSNYYSGALAVDEVGNNYQLVQYLGPDDTRGGWVLGMGSPLKFTLVFPALATNAKRLQIDMGPMSGCQIFEIKL